ncbi:Cytochrome b561 eukaryote [Macrophomina phaseolina MS6]|uniref:Cytochrome b561 eukaryote n=1 Tax=Macrophomina phaseolina (strain MS6) TaxID=1126212 RepID=K2QTP4_MACPH|nr:Cytochrome b561 eukaryote [Macrophomina phaseolina MS6]
MAQLRRLAIGLAVLANLRNAALTTASSLLSPRQSAKPNQTAPAAATFLYSDNPRAGNLTFSLTAVPAADDDVDFYMHLSAPADYQWVGVGVGRRMKNALIFLVYHDSHGDNVTFSPRVASGENEPSYRSSIDCAVYESAGVPRVGVLEDSDDNAYYSVNAHCRRVRAAVPELSLDLNSSTQPFIFALGPWNHDLESADKDAGIRRHGFYGSFTMDMRRATESNATLAGTAFGAQMDGAQRRGNLHEDDGSRGSATHAVLMCGVFLFVFPIGVGLLRGFERVQWHAGTQTGGLLVLCAGVGLGIWISKYYNKSKKINSAHQIIGLIVFALLFVQLGLGWFHHRVYLRSRSRTRMGNIHRYLGPVLLGAGLANGFIGFRFADASRSNLVYLLLVVAMFAILLMGVWYKRRKDRRKTAADQFGPPPPTAPPPYSAHPPPGRLVPSGGYESQPSRSDIALGDLGTRDAYYGGTQATQPRVMV